MIALAAARVVDGIPIGATVSIGLAPVDDRPPNIEALCERADKALYRAKALGRNRVECAMTNRSRLCRRRRWRPISRRPTS